MKTTAYTVRDQLLAHETETPNHAATVVEVFRHDLNANGRHQPRGWRTEVTASVLADRLPELLTGGFGLGPQLHAFRRVNPIKAKTPGPWNKATLDVLADLAQHLDRNLERSRAERIAQDAVPIVLPLVQNWLESESA